MNIESDSLSGGQSLAKPCAFLLLFPQLSCHEHFTQYAGYMVFQRKCLPTTLACFLHFPFLLVFVISVGSVGKCFSKLHQRMQQITSATPMFYVALLHCLQRKIFVIRYLCLQIAIVVKMAQSYHLCKLERHVMPQ